MSADSSSARKGRFRFSLANTLIFTAIIAVWIASFLAYRKSNALQLQKTKLLALSSRLHVVDVNRIQVATFPRMADGFTTWEVQVPENDAYDLRFAVGQMSAAGMPQKFERFPLTPGRHRITLHFMDSVREGYGYTVFVDGQSVLKRSMENDWMPNGWRQANALNDSRRSRSVDAAGQHLAGKLYTPRGDYGHFNGQSDNWVSGPGYRLWIDHAQRTYEPISPFIGFGPNSRYSGFGLRDGLRFRQRAVRQYEWTFTRPASQTNDTVLTIVPEFLVGDRVVLSDQTTEFKKWHFRNEVSGTDELSWQHDSNKTIYNAFLHAEVATASDIEPAIAPVMELRWDASRPNDVGLRLADTPANAELSLWRLRVVGGASQLWRLVDVGDRQMDLRKQTGDESEPFFSDPLPLKLTNDPDQTHVIAWRSDVTEPLQLLQKGNNKQNPYVGLNLFRGLPLVFETEIPRQRSPQRQPNATIIRARSIPDTPNINIPGGSVITEIRMELDSASDWVWLRAKPR